MAAVCVFRMAGAEQMWIQFSSILSMALSLLKSSERLMTCPHAVDGGPLGGPASLCPEKGCNLLKGAQLSKPRLGPELLKFANTRLPAVHGESAQGEEV